MTMRRYINDLDDSSQLNLVLKFLLTRFGYMAEINIIVDRIGIKKAQLSKYASKLPFLKRVGKNKIEMIMKLDKIPYVKETYEQCTNPLELMYTYFNNEGETTYKEFTNFTMSYQIMKCISIKMGTYNQAKANFKRYQVYFT